MRALWFLALIACDRAKPAPKAIDAAPAAAPIAVVVDAALTDAPIDAMVLDVPAQITRRVETGMITTAHDAETFTLQIDGTRALLTIELAHGVPKPGDMLATEIVRWEPVSKTQLAGTATIDGKTTRLDLGDGATRWSLACTPAMQAVAGTGATRRPHAPSAHSEGCGDTGRWVPAGTKKVAVLRCTLPADFDPDEDHPRHWTKMPSLSFAAAPGIEWVYVNDDCAMQGGDWRRIANDGSIPSVR